MINQIDTMLRFIHKMHSTIVSCPKCGTEQDLAECDYAEHYITMWGEDGPREFECGGCEYVMIVQERVARSFEVISDEE
jgi:Zn ribbon nucleic-acid-binding protein